MHECSLHFLMRLPKVPKISLILPKVPHPHLSKPPADGTLKHGKRHASASTLSSLMLSFLPIDILHVHALPNLSPFALAFISPLIAPIVLKLFILHTIRPWRLYIKTRAGLAPVSAVLPRPTTILVPLHLQESCARRLVAKKCSLHTRAMRGYCSRHGETGHDEAFRIEQPFYDCCQLYL